MNAAPNMRVQRTRSSPSEPVTRRRFHGEVLVWTLVASLTFNCVSTPASTPPANDKGLDCNSELHGRYPVKRSWLEKQVTVAEAEAKIMQDVPGLKAQDNPLLPDWTRLKNSMQPGDQLWLFTGCPLGCPPPPALSLGGEEGYALIRDCEVVDQVVLMMS
jgi:hypothetical protein